MSESRNVLVQVVVLPSVADV
jgi:hypothetical protein